jgi:hypothetical protein
MRFIGHKCSGPRCMSGAGFMRASPVLHVRVCPCSQQQASHLHRTVFSSCVQGRISFTADERGQVEQMQRLSQNAFGRMMQDCMAGGLACSCRSRSQGWPTVTPELRERFHFSQRRGENARVHPSSSNTQQQRCAWMCCHLWPLLISCDSTPPCCAAV